MTNYRSNWDRLLPICWRWELPSWICTNCVQGVLNGNGWDHFCAYRLIFMTTSLTICNRFSFNILMNVNEYRSIFNLVCKFFTLVLYSDGCHWIENWLFSDKEFPHFRKQEIHIKKAKWFCIFKQWHHSTIQILNHCAHVQKEGQNTQCLYIRFTWHLKNDGYQLCVLTDSLFEHLSHDKKFLH